MRSILLFFLLAPCSLLAQKTHKVKAKESIYSIARQYNISPKELAEFNKLTLSSGLNINQVIKIPNKKTTGNTIVTPAEKNNNVSTNAKNQDVETVVKKHTVTKGETLFQISKKYNVKIDELKRLNNLKTDAVVVGAVLVVEKKSKPSTEPVKEKISEEHIQSQTAPVTTNVSNSSSSNATEVKTTSVPVTNSVPEVTTPVKTSTRDFNGGFFGNEYNNKSGNSQHNETGRAAAFKSTSGWQDGKYYCLHNYAPAGAVVKITSNDNQRVVYARVLDVLPDIKQNEGILVRISNAAADELGISTEVFNVTIEY